MVKSHENQEITEENTWANTYWVKYMEFLSDIGCLGFTHDITCQIWDTWNYLSYCKDAHIKIIEAESRLFLKKLIFGKPKSESDHWVNTNDWDE